MSIVNWTGDAALNAAKDLIVSPSVTMDLLKMTPLQLRQRWQGRLIVDREEASSRHIRVEIKKQFYCSEMIIEIYDRQIKIGNELRHVLVNIDTPSIAGLSEDDLTQMNMAIAEAIEVYRHPAAWIQLNKDLGNTEVLF